MRQKLKTISLTKTNQYKKIHKKRWQRSELITLKNEFNKGECLKNIAKKLGRTETAINKVLSRSGIRTGTFKNSSTRKIIKTVQCESISDINAVIDYLNKRQYKVTCATNVRIHSDKLQYTINGAFVSAVKLLIIANKHKLEEGSPIFHMKDSEN